ncbi:hypothetical protein ACFE04_020758 [Oxalis oulophora]
MICGMDYAIDFDDHINHVKILQFEGEACVFIFCDEPLMLAKLASAMNEPTQETIETTWRKVGKFLAKWPRREQCQRSVAVFGREVTWALWRINGEGVEGRLLPKSHGSGKSFLGPHALRITDVVSRSAFYMVSRIQETHEDPFKFVLQTSMILTFCVSKTNRVLSMSLNARIERIASVKNMMNISPNALDGMASQL